jgi:uncharacterized protein YndB with AHSA1/START domain
MAKDSKQIEVQVTVPYPIELVWDAITKPEALSQWIMETDFKPVVGRKFQFRAKKNMAWRGWTDCEVLEVERPNRLQFTWQTMPKQSPTVITYILKSVPNGTHFRAIHAGFDKSHGWFSGLFIRTMLKAGLEREVLDWLPQVLENGKQGDFGADIDRSKKTKKNIESNVPSR